MIELKTAIIIVIIHLTYYAYFYVISEFQKIGMIRNTPNATIAKLRTAFKVNIHTFQVNSDHYGFALFNTIYLNESLFLRRKALMFAFHHEHYHLMNHHKRNTLLIRFFFSLLPVLMVFSHWIFFALAYSAAAYLIKYVSDEFERNANSHARQMIK